MTTARFRDGLQAIRSRPGLVALIYAVNMGLALSLAIPVAWTLHEVIAPTGFGDDLAAAFNLVLWAEAFSEAALASHAIHLLWAVPLVLLWKAAYSVGLLYALRDEGSYSFWKGVARHVIRSVLLGVIYLVIMGLSLAVVIALAMLSGGVFSGEIGRFWTSLVLTPSLIVLMCATIDMMRDVSRAALVVREEEVFSALATGLAAPFVHRGICPLYLAWMIPSLALVVATTILESSVAASMTLAIAGLFLGQQILMLLRAAASVGWYGSLAALTDAIWPRLASAPDPPASEEPSE